MQRLYKAFGEKEILKLVVGEIAQQLKASTPLKSTWVQVPAQHDYNNSSRGSDALLLGIMGTRFVCNIYTHISVFTHRHKK